MHIRYFAAALSILSPAIAAAQAAPAPQTTPAPAAKGAYSVEDTDLGTLLDNPETKAVLQKYIPDMINNDQIAMARSMTLKGLQQYAGDTLTDEKLAKINADLAKVPASK